MKPVIFVFVMSLLTGLFSCNATASQEADLEHLARQFQALRCQQDHLLHETEQLWDNVQQELSAQLPASMPTEEKHNMLAVRNASLIRMFETYETLDTSIQQLITAAEKQDQQIVVRLANIKEEQIVLDAQKRALFLEMEQKDKLQFSQQKVHFSALVNTACEDM